MDEGRVFLYLGTATGLAATPAWTAESNQEKARFGEVVTSAVPFGKTPTLQNPPVLKTFNGDAYTDVVIAAPGYDNGEVNEGRVFAYYGSALGVLPPTPSWTAESNQAGAHLGTAVAAAGWVNGDQYLDLIVGAIYHDGASPEQGRVSLYSGALAGLAASPSWTKDGDVPYAYSGLALGTAGDVNLDGFWDVIVGAPIASSVATEDILGRAALFHGKSGGLQPMPQWTRAGTESGSLLGLAVLSAGLYNSDSYGDVMVGTPRHGADLRGKVEVFAGSAAGLGSTPIFFLEGQPGAELGFSLGLAQDINGDGRFDLVVGAPGYSAPGLVREGAIVIVYGGTQG